MNKLRGSVVVPAREEGLGINKFLSGIMENVSLPIEVLIVVDDENDNTFDSIDFKNLGKGIQVRRILNDSGAGPANAIKYGISVAKSSVLVVTMADGSDDPSCIDNMIRLIERGCAMVVASRYMPGGQQIGGPILKRLLSRNASRILRVFGGVRIHDSTNSFRAFSSEFVREAKIESKNGFELGLELTAKAHKTNQLVAEIPTIWIDRQFGQSKFRLMQWLPSYLKWFFFCFTPNVSRIKNR